MPTLQHCVRADDAAECSAVPGRHGGLPRLSSGHCPHTGAVADWCLVAVCLVSGGGSCCFVTSAGLTSPPLIQFVGALCCVLHACAAAHQDLAPRGRVGAAQQGPARHSGEAVRPTAGAAQPRWFMGRPGERGGGMESRMGSACVRACMCACGSLCARVYVCACGSLCVSRSVCWCAG